MKKIEKANIIIIYSAAFIPVFMLCYACFWHKGLLPVYGIDGIGQYYPVFLHIGRLIRESLSGITSGAPFRFYDLSVGMGEDILGTLNYYGLGDPLNIIAVFSDGTSGPYLFSFVYYLRLYLGGLAFLVYCRRFGISKLSSAAAALCYAFCGYGIYAAGMYTQYGAMLYVFPLLLTGCERVLGREKGRWILYASAAYLGLCGFYFTYMCALGLIVYCAVRALFTREGVWQAALACGKCAGIFLLGLCLASPVLLPSLMSFLSSARSGSLGAGQLFILSNYIPSLTRRFVSDVNVMNGMRNYPVMIGAASLFFVSKDRRMIQLRIAVAALLVLLYLPITAIVMNGFSNPRDRWVFEAQLVLCAAFAVAADRIREMGWAHVYRAGLILATCNILLSFWGRYSGLGDNEKALYTDAGTVIASTASPVSASALIREDTGLFRVSGEFTSGLNGRPINDGMNAGYYGTFYWFSVVNENTQAFVDEATKVSNDWRSFGLGDENRYNSAAAVKYYLSKSGRAPQGFSPAERFEYKGEDWQVFVNDDFGGFAYLAGDDGLIRGYCEDCTYAVNDFSCTIPEDAKSAGIMTAFPYTKGWRAYINGKPAPTKNKDNFLEISAENISKGDIFTLHYVTPGLMAGAVAALLSLIAYMLLELVIRYKGRRPSGEGDKEDDTRQ